MNKNTTKKNNIKSNPFNSTITKTNKHHFYLSKKIKDIFKDKINKNKKLPLLADNKNIVNQNMNKYILPKINDNKIKKPKTLYIKKKLIQIKRKNVLNPFKNTIENKIEIIHTNIILKRTLKKENIKKEIINESNVLNNYNGNIKEIKDIYYNKMEGFYNNGSTCFMNSFIQILIHIPNFIELLKKYKDIFNKNHLSFYLLNVADNPNSDNLYNLKRKFNKLNSNVDYNDQDDSQEFGSEFIKILNDELLELNINKIQWDYKKDFKLDKKFESLYKNDKINKLNDLLDYEESEYKYGTIISELFYYYECSLIFNNNKLILINYLGEPDNKLSFNDFNENNFNLMNLDISDLLKNKYLKGNNKLIKLPKILMITLLRAVGNKPLIKINVKIDQKIDLKEYIDKDFGNYNKPTEYSLFALNICIGNNKSFGHYYAYILINKIWYKFDDLYVNKVSEYEIEKDLQYIYGIYYINDEYLNKLNINNF